MSTGLSAKQDILAVLCENRALLRSLGVRRLGLFGSFVRGEQRVDSDVDFLVEFEPDQKTFDHFMNLARIIHERFYCNRGFAAATSLAACFTAPKRAGSPLGRSTSCSRMPPFLPAPRARLAGRLHDFVTNRHE